METILEKKLFCPVINGECHGVNCALYDETFKRCMLLTTMIANLVNDYKDKLDKKK